MMFIIEREQRDIDNEYRERKVENTKVDNLCPKLKNREIKET